MDLRQILLKSKGVVFLKLMCQLNVLITDTDDEKSFLNVTIVYFPITFFPTTTSLPIASFYSTDWTLCFPIPGITVVTNLPTWNKTKLKQTFFLSFFVSCHDKYVSWCNINRYVVLLNVAIYCRWKKAGLCETIHSCRKNDLSINWMNLC